MKLQSHTGRTYKEKEYEKYWIVIPKEIIHKLNWKKGYDLSWHIHGDKLIVRHKIK